MGQGLHNDTKTTQTIRHEIRQALSVPNLCASKVLWEQPPKTTEVAQAGVG